MRTQCLTAAIVIGLPLAAAAQGVTQSRDGLSTASHANPQSSNSMPSGGVNATTGPQSRPAYPSGSTTANPGAAFVRSTTPKPATGAAQTSPGNISTTTVTAAGAVKQPTSAGVGQPSTPPK